MIAEFYLHDIPNLRFNFSLFWSVKGSGLNKSGELFMQMAESQSPATCVDPRIVCPPPTAKYIPEGTRPGPSNKQYTPAVSQRRVEVGSSQILKRRRSLSEDWVARPEMPIGKRQREMERHCFEPAESSIDSFYGSATSDPRKDVTRLPSVQTAPKSRALKRKAGLSDEGSSADGDDDYKPRIKRRKVKTVMRRQKKTQVPRPASTAPSPSAEEDSSFDKGGFPRVCGKDGCPVILRSTGDATTHGASKRHTKISRFYCPACRDNKESEWHFQRKDSLKRHLQNPNNGQACQAHINEHYKWFMQAHNWDDVLPIKKPS